MSTGENIKRIRKSKGLTQKKLGELSGINEAQIRRYELGKKNANPKKETLQKIATALDVSVNDLLDWQDIPEIANKVCASNLIDLKEIISDERYCFSPKELSDLKSQIDNYISIGNEISDFDERTKYFDDISEKLGEELLKHLLNSCPYSSLLNIADLLSYYLAFTFGKQGDIHELLMDLYENKYLRRNYWENQ